MVLGLEAALTDLITTLRARGTAVALEIGRTPVWTPQGDDSSIGSPKNVCATSPGTRPRPASRCVWNVRSDMPSLPSMTTVSGSTPPNCSRTPKRVTSVWGSWATWQQTATGSFSWSRCPDPAPTGSCGSRCHEHGPGGRRPSPLTLTQNPSPEKRSSLNRHGDRRFGRRTSELVVRLRRAEDCRLSASPLEAVRLCRPARRRVTGRQRRMTDDELATVMSLIDLHRSSASGVRLFGAVSRGDVRLGGDKQPHQPDWRKSDVAVFVLSGLDMLVLFRQAPGK